ncbi:hypothetical protein [Methanocorpusculum labreanum]|uniref:hypothetical protein n=1 Tax=Methanocorpusculum labreanum TaxID=83984 RepID=UPI0011808F2A|nr:hypothetical protein [Methanocorpusculum labreanum]
MIHDSFYFRSKIYDFPQRKTGKPVFPTAFFQAACDSCAGDKPEQSTQAQEKCDSRGFVEIRGWFFS